MKRALAAEFMGTLLFQLVGGTENSPVHNGVVLAVVIYMTAAISGGVVNPAVATGLLIAGEMPRTKWALYVIAQLSGAVVGALIAGLIYDECYVTPDHPQHMGCFKDYSYFNTGPGCVPDTPPVRLRRLPPSDERGLSAIGGGRKRTSACGRGSSSAPLCSSASSSRPLSQSRALATWRRSPSARRCSSTWAAAAA